MVHVIRNITSVMGGMSQLINCSMNSIIPSFGCVEVISLHNVQCTMTYITLTDNKIQRQLLHQYLSKFDIKATVNYTVYIYLLNAKVAHSLNFSSSSSELMAHLCH